MYPESMPQQAWYAIARSSELSPGSLTQRWVHGLPIALFRRADGELHALIDQCVHRQMPLTMGEIVLIRAGGNVLGAFTDATLGWRALAEGGVA